ncbi:MAG TPA: MFS transporter [Bryobacteraceae bacterium]|jgi:ACS family glucarate transporter-like MFS transporter|nr:MFS transporter [Bryobacteraceae bacterium]
MPIRWLLIFWMFAISAISFLDRVNISVASRFIQQEFHISDLQLGPVFSSFLVGYALLQAPAGRLADRFGSRLILTLGTLWWGIFTALITALSAGMGGLLFLLLAVRFSLGAGEAVLFPASNRLVANWIPSNERGLANGLIFAGVGAGAGITPPLVTHIVLHYGWRASFWMSAIVGVVAGVAWYWLARDRPEDHPWITPQETALIERGLPEPPNELQIGRPLPWRVIIGSRDLQAIAFSYFTYGYAAWIFFAWFFKYLSDVRGLDLKSSSYYSMLPFIAMAAGSTIGGRISDILTRRYGRRIGRCGVAVAGIALAAVFIASGTQVESARLASVVLAGGAGALYLSQSSFWSVTADMAGASAGSASGVMNMAGQIGGIVTASLTPLIAHRFSWTASFLVAAALCAAGSLAWLFVDPQVELAERG